MEAADDVAQRAGDEEVLLDQAQLLARLGLVIRVKNLGDRLALRLGRERLAVAAAVERLEIDLLRRARFPQAQEIHRVGAVAGDRDVVGHADDLRRVHPARDVVALVVEDVFHVAVELDRLRVFRPHDFPRRAEAHPVVGQLDLVAVAEFLAEEAELVMDAVADRRDNRAWPANRGSRPRDGPRPPLPRPMSYSSPRSSFMSRPSSFSACSVSS